MKKVLLKAYLKKNLGDDLFVKIIVDRYKNNFMIFSKENLKFLNNRDNVIQYNNPLLDIYDKLCKKILKKHDMVESYLKRKNDIFVYIGGSLFIENNNLDYWKHKVKIYRKNYLPYYILGSNVGPYTNNKFLKLLNKDVFSNAEDVCFREEYSYDLFKDLNNVRKASDIVFSLDTTQINVKNSKKVVFSVIDAGKKMSSELHDIYEKKIIDLIRYFRLKGYEIVLMSFCKLEGDEEAIKSIMEKCDAELNKNISTYYYDGNLDEALNIIGDCEIVVATRFHASILGLVLGKSIIPIAYSNKTINVLKDMNYEGIIITKDNIKEFDVNKLSDEDIQYKHNVSLEKQNSRYWMKF